MKVVTVFTGRVKSRLARIERVLPETSMYMRMNQEYEARVKHGIDDSMPADAYSKSVVAQILKPVPKGWIWEGRSSWSVWFMSTFLSKQRVVRLRTFKIMMGTLSADFDRKLYLPIYTTSRSYVVEFLGLRRKFMQIRNTTTGLFSRSVTAK